MSYNKVIHYGMWRLLQGWGRYISIPPHVDEGWPNSKCSGEESKAQETWSAPEILVNVISGSPNPCTMGIIGQFNGIKIFILIVTGSTHNFVDPFVIAKAQIPVYHTPRLSVKVAKRQALCSEGITKAVNFKCKVSRFFIEFYVLTLGGCDVVLGV